MPVGSFPRKLARTVARGVSQCGMVSQAVAFNMFLVFLSQPAACAWLMSRSLAGKNGRTWPHA